MAHPILVLFFDSCLSKNTPFLSRKFIVQGVLFILARYTNIRCVVYTGDTEATGAEILAKSHQRFNISLPRTGNTDLEFVFLNRRKWVEASPYPFFTLLGQSVGSLVLGFEALLKFVPDVYLDTMGYAFTIPLFKYMGGCTVGCYVHYPTISTDMLQRVSDRAATYNNAGFISQSPILSSLKLIYYKIFAYMYGVVGKRSHVVMVNSSWTKGHIMSLWQAKRYTHVLYPPCDTREFMKISLREDCDKKHHTIVSIAQFRPEKDHQLQIRAFHKFLTSRTDGRQETYELLLVGSCRNAADSERVVALRKLCDELELADSVKFRLNVSFEELKQIMTDATIGLHTMWNEHFGIGMSELELVLITFTLNCIKVKFSLRRGVLPSGLRTLPLLYSLLFVVLQYSNPPLLWLPSLPGQSGRMWEVVVHQRNASRQSISTFYMETVRLASRDVATRHSAIKQT